MAKDRMPKQLFVQFEKVEKDSDPKYWIGREQLELFDKEGTVGIYRLVGVKELKIRNVLED